MIISDKQINNLFLYWLTTCLALVFIIVIIGGLTRLTNSGLSITEWELFKGILPPLNNQSWSTYFEEYKKIPQFELINKNMNLNEFKVIFYWEYFHRFFARIIGLFFILPLIYFYFSKKINKKYIKNCFIIFLLILFQGLIGWYMVKSGLINDITVSHYRLSIHLIMAFVILSSIFWLIKNVKEEKNKIFFKFSKKNILFFILLTLIFFQIVIGAFVSGLDAGRVYQTWPLMGHSYFPDDTTIKNLKSFLDFHNPSLVQFYHRNLAYMISIYIFFLSVYIYKNKLKKLFKSMKLLLIFLLIQIILGILTLISGLNIYLASAHQISSMLLVFTSINLYYFKSK